MSPRAPKPTQTYRSHRRAVRLAAPAVLLASFLAGILTALLVVTR